MKYNYNTFKELFDHHINYAYESRYGVEIDSGYPLSGIRGIEYVSFYKLTIYSNGELEYKGRYETYDPRLWPKVLALAKSLHETEAEKILFRAKKNSPD